MTIDRDKNSPPLLFPFASYMPFDWKRNNPSYPSCPCPYRKKEKRKSCGDNNKNNAQTQQHDPDPRPRKKDKQPINAAGESLSKRNNPFNSVPCNQRTKLGLPSLVEVFSAKFTAFWRQTTPD